MTIGARTANRRRFLVDAVRVVGIGALSGTVGFLAGRKGRATETRWQIDPDKCVGCRNCATFCVLDESAVKCVQCFDMCGHCDICYGYLATDCQDIDTAAENQLCPTGAVVRTFIEMRAGQRFYEYTIDRPHCIGCGTCVKGCALLNGSLYLQVLHDRCLNCNDCAISAACPSQAFERIPIETPYRMKRQALAIVRQKAEAIETASAREFLSQVYEP